jgi:hypothetical protein
VKQERLASRAASSRAANPTHGLRDRTPARRCQFPVSVDIPSGGLASGHDGAYWTLTFIAQAGFGGLDVAFRVMVEG